MKKWYVFLLLSMFFMYTAAAQEVKEALEPAANTVMSQDQIFEERLWAYLAVAKENADLCKTKYCEYKFKNIIDPRYIGEGRCEAIQREGFTKDLCLLVKGANCGSKKDVVQNTMCNAAVSGDVSLVTTASEAINDPEQSVEDLAEILGIIEGYREKKAEACEKYIKEYIAKETSALYMCSILFSPVPEDAFKQAVKELKALSVAQSQGNAELCWEINVMQLRQQCFKGISKPAAVKEPAEGAGNPVATK